MDTVFINGRFLSQPLTGTQRYARETLAALDRLLVREGAPFEFIVLAPRAAEAPALERIQVERIGPLRGHAWEQLTLAKASRGALLLSFGPTGPLFKRDQVLTIHDASVHALPQAFRRAFRIWYRAALPLLARRSRAVITVSRFARGELTQRFGIPAQKVWISGGGWQHVQRTSGDSRVLEAHGLRRREYVLVVASIARHKNLEILTHALPRMAEPRPAVAVVGATDSRVFARVPLQELSRLTFLGRVDERSLLALYEGAAALVHPSLYEGFGLPPLEAMALGCPVIASNAGSIPEVCGPAALYFDPRDPESLAACLRRLLGTPDERERLAQLGHLQLRRHSWERCARTLLEALASCPPTSPRAGPTSSRISSRAPA